VHIVVVTVEKVQLEHIAEVPYLPIRKSDSSKADYGRIVIVAGSRGMSGAAILCGTAALRGGAGLVTVSCASDIQDVVAMGHPCYMTCPLPAKLDDLPKADVIAIGPGLGKSPLNVELVHELVTSFQGSLVIDADALLMFSGVPLKRSIPAVLTPHPGEFASLVNRSIAEVQARREELATAYARGHGVVLVLKGSQSIVTDGVRIYVNTTGNPGMATGGCGDVLTGLIAALIGQKLTPFDAAVLGVWLHGRAGDLAAEELGEVSMTASDLLEWLPNAIRERVAHK
jgi:ADP-dependent NAD(P)H-hydrate dehydratase